MALKNQKVTKALGLDVLHPSFFKEFWNFVKVSIYRCIQDIFVTSFVPPLLNRALIYLIPKGNIHETINAYRPISICNTILKIISKVAITRLKSFLPNLVSPFQVVFVPKRKPGDNIIIFRKLMHSINKSKIETSNMIIQLDLEKTYDSTKWNSIRNILKFF